MRESVVPTSVSFLFFFLLASSLSLSCYSRSPVSSAAISAYLLSSDSYIQTSFPHSSISECHRRFTKRRPVIFLTVQKSKAAKRTTTMNVRMSSPRKTFRKRNAKREQPLKATLKMQAKGCFAVDRRPSSVGLLCK